MGNRKTIQKRLERARWRPHLHGSERDQESLAKAAEYFRLDPKNPTGRERLLYKLADVIFGPDGKKGRPKGTRTSWGDRLLLLGELYVQKKQENPKLSNAEIARLIKSECEDFKHDDPDQIRQRLPEARLEYEEWWAERLMYVDVDVDVDDAAPDYEPEEVDYPDF